MITILSSPKPFVGIAGENQHRAIGNWLSIPSVEVIIYGDSPGTAQACRELGARHVPGIASTGAGVPYFGAIIEHAEQHASGNLLLYTNCDILFDPNVLPKIPAMIDLEKYLLIGQRIDLKQGVRPDTAPGNWCSRVGDMNRQGKAELAIPHAKDYFLFQKGFWNGLNELVIGRGGYDCALVAFALRKKIPVIDATCALLALHQFHDYNHVKAGWKQVMMGEDAKSNNLKHNIVDTLRTSDASLRLIGGKLVPNSCNGDWLRCLELKVRFGLGQEWSVYPFRALWHLLVKTRLYRPKLITLGQVLLAMNQRCEIEKETY